MASFVVLTINGLSFGLILFLLSAGLTLTLGLMRIANLAHCGFAMLGGYIALFAVTNLKLGLLEATPIALVGTMLLALLLDRTVYRWAREVSQLQQVMLTIGLTFVMVAAVNLIFGASIRALPIPEVLSGNYFLGAFAIPIYRLFLVALSLLVAGAIWFVIRFTNYGARLRAAIDNPRMAQCIGSNVDAIVSSAFVAGCGLAALGGALGTSMYPLEPTYALIYLVPVLLVVAVGGLGSLEGSLLAAILVGLLDTYSRYLLPAMGGAAIYAIAAGILLMRPRGLLGQHR
ncbi:amino acid/amide ABC transporter membrane protein 1 (HAAT family) [Bradyrhizobium macuxiense]|uniref:Amino acid/amide ABC transporter membrane protein 1 (HAAT family) n=1 Tax=Bradyrhizobium macuxiense TaxID=1755647 RepID=A0A560KXB6_9BRAD|nr:branched-chain amino acid ABC transporter permease [Bradyrhizobium macuxiense]TWB87812.1 amino acid/amide ABC transporter membrane protein 1 (HAAT family) [Bradyrhizobium macuxiense]